MLRWRNYAKYRLGQREITRWSLFTWVENTSSQNVGWGGSLMYMCQTCLGCSMQELFNVKKSECENYKSCEVSNNERIHGNGYMQRTIRQTQNRCGTKDSELYGDVYGAADK